MPEKLKADLIDAFEYTFGRLVDRLDGIPDSEFFWEPVSDCLTLRVVDGGLLSMDARRGGDTGTSPLTTIAWRVSHIGEVLAGASESFRSGLPTPFRQRDWPATAAKARPFLEVSFSEWRRTLKGLTEAEMWKSLGTAWEEFSDASHFALSLHTFDELVHHAAEVGVLRDLYAHSARGNY